MKKIQITKTIKKLEEFNKEQQEEILNNYRYINVEIDFFNNYLIEEFINELKNKTNIEVSNNDIIWEVGSRDSKFGVYSKKIINRLISKFEDKGVYDIDTTDKIGSFLNHRGGGICSQNHTEFNLAQVYFEDDNITEKEKETITKEINNIIDTIIELCSEYHKKNEEAYNYNLSDEAIKETIKANDYDFDSETLKIY